ncbi:sigma-54-dependent Fis family transcriptional regulator [Psychrobacillus sp. OK032]|uniref:sigma-54 interaction domain-containing protein n=1 Tax=Psychrobacillus sp. OK032 TaxID=1884358 RepID=UPI0008AD31DC|nr:sigma 54-interacting transcriptional regulator [Psychrobacillus sp. OK032]SES00678.1 transcriptional regulator, propionate catabolism operon regulatory protein [Psychrobacillus sp. OK032]
MNKDMEKQIQFYQSIVDLSHSGIAGVDIEGRILIYNQSAADFLGVPVKEAIGKLLTEVNPVQPGLIQVLAEQSVQRDQLRKVGQNTAIINRAPIYYENELIGAISTVRDITELQQYEEKIRRKINQQGLKAKWTLEQIIAKSEPMRRLIELAKKYATVDSTLLLQGESGTGKEMLAQGIHMVSNRKDGPFVALNCAALPETLLESELFGYEEGAFTGARRGGKPGLFELAHHGTIFLDEMGELPLLLQARLLRVLQEREVMRVGGNKVIPVDVRIIAATNRDLVRQMKDGLFREDLYFRLAILVLTIPPLRDRLDDIPHLTKAFLKDWKKTYYDQLTNEDIQKLQAYSWPGNVRELRNLLERAVVLADAGEPFELFSSDVWLSTEKLLTSQAAGTVESIINKQEENEEEKIRRILQEEKGHMVRAADRLAMHRSTLWRKLKKYSIDI